MNFRTIIITIIYSTLYYLSYGQSAEILDTNQYWTLTDDNSIEWNVITENRLPHGGNIEMSGKRVSAIIYYDIDENRNLTLTKDVIFPQLRTYNRTDQPEWKKYRAYFRREGNSTHDPIINIGEKSIIPGPVEKVEINGIISFTHASVEGIQISKSIYPSMEDRFLSEIWTIKNTTDDTLHIKITEPHSTQSEYGYKGLYTYHTYITEGGEVTIPPGKVHSSGIYYAATITSSSTDIQDESIDEYNWIDALLERNNFLYQMRKNLVLTTPDPVLNTLFYFSKIRATESIFESSMGLIHSPGGGNYYLGTWANDQVEYSGPFFPYLGYPNANDAAYNTYKKFLENIPASGHIPYAFEVDGNFPMTNLDRGDAAMIAYGTSQYVLSTGNKEIANELWPLIIENYFGANIEGLETYKYFKENKYLRHWICLPLNMGIEERKEATLTALFDKLWTDNGILVEYKPESETQKIFWDRGTLYAFRGAMKAGAVDLGLQRLVSYSRKRLLGDHVPYAVEAYPENNMKHLSAESALYARIFTEGMLGIEPISLSEIKIKPSLPKEWNEIELRAVHLMGKVSDFKVERQGDQLRITVTQNDKVISQQTIEKNGSMKIALK